MGPSAAPGSGPRVISSVMRSPSTRRVLGRGVLDRAPAGGKEGDVRDPRGREAARGHGERDHVARGRHGRRPRGGLRHVTARGGDQRRAARVDRRRPRGDGQRDLDRSFLRDADLLAHEPARPAAKRHARAGREVGRGRDRKRQHDLARVAERHRRARRDPLGIRPRDRSRREAGRQRPLDPRGFARVARIDPVGVPARRDLLAQPEPEGSPRPGGDVADELDPHLRRSRRRRRIRPRGRRGALRRGHTGSPGTGRRNEGSQAGGEQQGGRGSDHGGPIVASIAPAVTVRATQQRRHIRRTIESRGSPAAAPGQTIESRGSPAAAPGQTRLSGARRLTDSRSEP